MTTRLRLAVATVANVARVPRLTECLNELFGDPLPLLELLIGHRLGFVSARQLAAWGGWGLPIAFHGSPNLTYFRTGATIDRPTRLILHDMIDLWTQKSHNTAILLCDRSKPSRLLRFLASNGRGAWFLRR